MIATFRTQYSRPVTWAILALIVGCTSLLPATCLFGFNIHGVSPVQPVEKGSHWFSIVGKFDNGCIGTRVGERLVLTSLRCMLDPEATKNGELAINRKIKKFHLGLAQIENALTSSQSVKVVQMWHVNVEEPLDTANDWALIEVDESFPAIESEVTISPVLLNDEDKPVHTDVRIILYPGSYQNGADISKSVARRILPKKRSGRNMFTHRCSVNYPHKKTGVVFHLCPTTETDYGAPMFIETENGDFELVGIHTNSIKPKGFSTEGFFLRHIRPGQENDEANSNYAIPVEPLSNIIMVLNSLSQNGLHDSHIANERFNLKNMRFAKNPQQIVEEVIERDVDTNPNVEKNEPIPSPPENQTNMFYDLRDLQSGVYQIPNNQFSTFGNYTFAIKRTTLPHGEFQILFIVPKQSLFYGGKKIHLNSWSHLFRNVHRNYLAHMFMNNNTGIRLEYLSSTSVLMGPDHNKLNTFERIGPLSELKPEYSE